ncbi:hypothetical protein B0H13DRAFT_2673759 [Mycena leptocephala]|nr:hypothetical protein B0H13DRAFT_2673759 [Mycena leptocephala]
MMRDGGHGDRVSQFVPIKWLVALSLHRLPPPAPALAPPCSLLQWSPLKFGPPFFKCIPDFCVTLPLSFFALPCTSVVFLQRRLCQASRDFKPSNLPTLALSNISSLQAHKPSVKHLNISVIHDLKSSSPLNALAMIFTTQNLVNIGDLDIYTGINRISGSETPSPMRSSPRTVARNYTYSIASEDSEEGWIMEESGDKSMFGNTEQNWDRSQLKSQDVSLSEPVTMDSEEKDFEDLDSDSGGNEVQNSEDLDGSPEDIAAVQELIEQTPQEDPDLPGYQQLLGALFSERYEESGNLNDLEASVKHSQMALDLTPEGHSDRTNALQDLGAALSDRYQKLGELADMEAALNADQEVVDLTPLDHPDRAGRLQGLAASFSDRYHRLGELKDLEAALKTSQEAVDLTPLDILIEQVNCKILLYPSGTDIRGWKDTLIERMHYKTGAALSDRYQNLGELADMEAALKADQEVVDLTPLDHPDRAGRLQGLAASFSDRYHRLGELKDLEAALKTSQEAVDLTPLDILIEQVNCKVLLYLQGPISEAG